MTNKFDRINTNANKKYIIRNCPAYSKDALDFCFAKNATQAICYNCTDCVLKQIYKLCKEDYTQFGDKELRYDTLEDIIKLLDIQEVK